MSKYENNCLIHFCSILFIAVSMQGCVTTGMEKVKSLGKTAVTFVGCGLGGYGASKLASALVKAETKATRMTPSEIKKKERSYEIGLALVGCGIGAKLANTVYGKLSERGKKIRETEMQAALNTAKPRTYRDPENPILIGKISIESTTVDPETKKECMIMQDALADRSQNESAYLKYCRTAVSKDPLKYDKWKASFV